MPPFDTVSNATDRRIVLNFWRLRIHFCLFILNSAWICRNKAFLFYHCLNRKAVKRWFKFLISRCLQQWKKWIRKNWTYLLDRKSARRESPWNCHKKLCRTLRVCPAFLLAGWKTEINQRIAAWPCVLSLYETVWSFLVPTSLYLPHLILRIIWV